MFGKFAFERKVRRLFKRLAIDLKISEDSLLSRWDFDLECGSWSLRSDLYARYKAYSPTDKELICMLVDYGYFDNELAKHGAGKVSTVQKNILRWCTEKELKIINGEAVAANLELRFQGRDTEQRDPFEQETASALLGATTASFSRPNVHPTDQLQIEDVRQEEGNLKSRIGLCKEQLSEEESASAPLPNSSDGPRVLGSDLIPREQMPRDSWSIHELIGWIDADNDLFTNLLYEEEMGRVTWDHNSIPSAILGNGRRKEIMSSFTQIDERIFALRPSANFSHYVLLRSFGRDCVREPAMRENHIFGLGWVDDCEVLAIFRRDDEGEIYMSLHREDHKDALSELLEEIEAFHGQWRSWRFGSADSPSLGSCPW